MSSIFIYSYQFTYPFTWIITILCIFMIVRKYLKNFLTIDWTGNMICFLVLGGFIVGMYKIVERIRYEREWRKVSALALGGDYDSIRNSYEKLEKSFADDPYFLYNYAAVLLKIKTTTIRMMKREIQKMNMPIKLE